MMFLQLLTLLLLLPAGLAAGYYLALTLASFRPDPEPRRRRLDTPLNRFAIVIPAHNEAAALPALLDSIARLDYPTAAYQVIVVADHCTDETPQLARARGTICLERTGQAMRGKGQALAWALPQVLELDVDAVVVLDADCQLTPDALRCFSRHLNEGDRVLQACYTVANSDVSVISFVSAAASLLENEFFYAPKSRLGLAVMLRGTGMVFHRDVLARLPWQAGSIVEDAEYTIRLYQAGWRVHFIARPCLSTLFPQRADQLRVQRQRWIGGGARLALAQSWRLAFQGLRRGELPLLDLAWTLLAAQRSLVAVQLLVVLGLSLACLVGAPGPVSLALLAASASLLGCYLSYFAVGCWRLGLDDRRWRLLVRSPAVLAQILGFAVSAILPGRSQGWARTPRM